MEAVGGGAVGEGSGGVTVGGGAVAVGGLGGEVVSAGPLQVTLYIIDCIFLR